MKRALLCLLLCAAGLRAEEEPTPFWMPPPPEKKEPAKPKAKKKPVRIEPLEIKETPPPRPAEPPVEPTWIAPAPAATAQVPAAPAPQAPAVAAVPPGPAPWPPRGVAGEPAAPRPIALRRWSVAAVVGAWGKSSSDGSGRSWDLAWGLRTSFAYSASLELDLSLARSAGTAGSPFVNASLAHNLAILRAFWVLGDRYAALLGGGAGIALAQTHYSLLPSTDPGVVASGLDAVAVKPVIAVTAAARARFFGGLEARGEVSAVARDGRLELLPLLGLGAAF